VQEMLDALKMNTQAYNGFPIVKAGTGDDKRCVGLITRHALMVILNNLGRVEDCNE
jgi:CBS domain-containing protein